MVDENMVNNVEECWMNLRKCLKMLNKAEQMHEEVMRFADPDQLEFPTTAKMSQDMVAQLWNVTMDAQDDLGWALESLLNGVTYD